MERADINDLDNFEPVARIVVIGVGGAGNNAVNRMIDENINKVEFYVMNTDKQALSTSKSENRIVLGDEVTKGLGAGGDPEMGKKAAEASEKEIKEIVKGADMVFIAAGMGKGTGTGAAPVVARFAKESGALTVAIVTRPFTFEGPQRIQNAVKGLNDLKDNVDSIIIVSNDKLLMEAGNASIDQAFQESDRVLAQSVKTVADLILVPAMINLDFADVKSTLQGSGVALIGFGMGEGPHRDEDAAQNAINCPLLEASVSGSRRAICAATCGTGVTLYEVQNCVRRISDEAGGNIDIKFGVSINPYLGDKIILSVIAADFAEEYDIASVPNVVLPTKKEDYGDGISIAPKEKTVSDLSSNAKSEEEDDFYNDILPDFLKSGE